MKLLLTSGGITNNSMVKALKDLVQRPFKELNLAFIPTAANLEEGDKWWLIKDLKTCQELGFKAIDLVDISALPQKIWKPRLESANILFVGGGNTYHLMYWINKSGLKDLLSKLLESRIYIGISAGSIVTIPSLILSSAEKEILEKIGEEIFDRGLGFVDFLIEPHINSKYFPELTFDYAKKQAEKLNKTVYALDDQTAIKVDNGKIEIISEGEWKKFN